MKSSPLIRVLAGIFRGDQMYRVIGLVIIVLGAAFLTVATLSYVVSRERMRDLIVSKELPLTSEVVYADIQRNFAKAIQASAVMAGDTFLRDWALEGEKNPATIRSFLGEMQRVNAAFTAYFVSDLTHRYYTPQGILKAVSKSDDHDGWFFDLEQGKEPYVIQVDTDQNHNNTLTVFVNYRVFDYRGTFIGIAGIGFNVDSVRATLNAYQQKFDLATYFVDHSGRVTMSGGDRAHVYNVNDRPELAAVFADVLKGQTGALEYNTGDQTALVNVRYMPELGWYLFVEREEDSVLGDMRRTLYVNLAVAALATAIVAAVLTLAAARYRYTLDKLAVTDGLTHLTTRHAFHILLRQAAKSAMRAEHPVSAVLFGIDRMNGVNEKFGHVVGDQAIKTIAAVIEQHARAIDVVCRWDGDVILLLLQDCKPHKALAVADAARQDIERIVVPAGARELKVTVSAGVATMQARDSEETLLARLNEGLRAAKAVGGNCIISSGRTL